MIENVERNIVCRQESIDSNKSDERMRINSESSNEDFEHLEPLELVDIKRYRDLTER